MTSKSTFATVGVFRIMTLAICILAVGSTSQTYSEEPDVTIKGIHRIAKLKGRVDACCWWPQKNAFLCLTRSDRIAVVMKVADAWQVIPLKVERPHWMTVCGDSVVIGTTTGVPTPYFAPEAVQIVSSDLSVSSVLGLSKSSQIIVDISWIKTEGDDLFLFCLDATVDHTNLDCYYEPVVLRASRAKAEIITRGTRNRNKGGNIGACCQIGRSFVAVGWGEEPAMIYTVNPETMALSAKASSLLELTNGVLDLSVIKNPRTSATNPAYTQVVFLSDERLWRIDTAACTIESHELSFMKGVAMTHRSDQLLVVGYGIGLFSGRESTSFHGILKKRFDEGKCYQSCATSDDGRFALCGGIQGELDLVEFE